MNTFQEFDDLLQIAHNTYAIRQGDDIAIRLHLTDIIVFSPCGDTVYNTGGWYSVTTKQRLNRFGPVGVYQKKGEWYYYDDTPFIDGASVGRWVKTPLDLGGMATISKVTN
jgi:hypothetical protein